MCKTRFGTRRRLPPVNDCDTCAHNVTPFDDSGACKGCTAPMFQNWKGTANGLPGFMQEEIAS